MVTVRKIGEAITVRVVGGAITVRVVGGAITVRIVGGAITVRKIGGAITVRIVGGGITVRVVSEAITVRIVGGGITARMVGEATYKGEMHGVVKWDKGYIKLGRKSGWEEKVGGKNWWALWEEVVVWSKLGMGGEVWWRWVVGKGGKKWLVRRKGVVSKR